MPIIVSPAKPASAASELAFSACNAGLPLSSWPQLNTGHLAMLARLHLMPSTLAWLFDVFHVMSSRPAGETLAEAERQY